MSIHVERWVSADLTKEGESYMLTCVGSPVVRSGFAKRDPLPPSIREGTPYYIRFLAGDGREYLCDGSQPVAFCSLEAP